MRTLATTIAMLFSALAWADSAPQQSTGRLWITDVVIVSPESLDHVEPGSVLIEDGRIVRVERNRRAKPPAGAALFSGHRQYLIPGLIDSHVHLATVPGMSSEQGAAKQAIIQEYFQQLPRSYLYFGYTTLVDLAVFEAQILREFRQAPLHPDLYDCGASLPFANGYPMSFIPPAFRFAPFPNFLYDGKQADRIPARFKPEEHTPEAAVARVKSSGGVCVKTYFERGFGSDRNLPVMDPEVLAGVRQAASRNGLVLLMHANGFEAQRFAVDGDADVIVHGMWHWGKLDQSPALPDEIRQLLDRIVEKRIGYQPTIRVLHGEIAYFDPEYLKMDSLSKVAPKRLLEWFGSPEGKWFGKDLRDGGTTDAEMRNRYEQNWLRRVRQVVAYLASKDANFVFGTDTPSSPTYGNLPGLNGYLEMLELRKAGLSLAQIFRAATISNAREFKLDAQLGTIEPGKIANLVLLKKSPLESVGAYDSIDTVFVHGQPVPRAVLSADSNGASAVPVAVR